MEKANETNLPQITQPIRVTPTQLRLIADKLDQSAKNALPGQVVRYAITKETTLDYDPEIPLFSLAADSRRMAPVQADREEYPDTK